MSSLALPLYVLRRRWPPVGDVKMYASTQFLLSPLGLAPVGKAEMTLYHKFLRAVEGERARCDGCPCVCVFLLSPSFLRLLYAASCQSLHCCELS